MGTGSAGRSVTIALRGTTPVTSEVVIAAAGGAAAAGVGSFEPQAAQHDNATMSAAVRLGMKVGW